MTLMAVAPVAAVYLAPGTSTVGGGVAAPSNPGGSRATVNCQNPCKVVIKNSVFGTGQPVVIAKGTQVIWVNGDDTTHTSTSNTGIWDTGILQVGHSSEPVTFQNDGVFPYFCNVHPMTGVVQVVG